LAFLALLLPIIAISWALSYLVPLATGLEAPPGAEFWPIAFLTVPLWFTVWNNGVTPLFRLTNLMPYRSDLLLTTWAGPGKLELHSGSLFDDFGLSRLEDAGPRIRRAVMCLYLEGLVELADSVERGELDPETVIHGTSWFFSDHSARRLAAYERWVTVLGMLDILVMTYFANGHWTRKAETTGQNLLEHRSALRDRLSRLRRRASTAADPAEQPPPTARHPAPKPSRSESPSPRRRETFTDRV